MKGYFQTTLTENRTTPQNTFIGSITSEFKPLSSMCIPVSLLALFQEFM